MKKSLLMKTMLLLCCLLVGGSAWADNYVKVTSTGDITSGQYLIVYETDKVAFDGSLTTLDAKENTIDVTISDSKITATAETEAAEFTIDATKGTLKSASGYYIGQTTYSNGLRQSATVEDGYTNTFSIDASGNAVITVSTSGGDVTLKYNKANNQLRFRYYKIGQQDIQLYKKESTKTPSNLALTGAPIALSFDLYNNSDDQVISYTSSSTGDVTIADNAYATFDIDQANKKITVHPTAVTPGVQVITVNQAATATYTAGSATFTISIENSDPTLPGSASNPFTVAEAIEYIGTLGAATSPTDVYVQGIISKVQSYSSTYKSITYWISDDGSETGQMEVYGGKGLGGADFSAKEDLTVGTAVMVKGKVKMYNTTPEFDQNNELVTVEFNLPTVSAAGWATYVTLKPVRFTDGDAFVVVSADSKVNLESVTDVPNNTPVLLKGAGAKKAKYIASASAITNELLISNGGEIDGYVLANKASGVGFYKWNGGSLTSGRVYLPTSAVSTAREFIGFENDATAIEAVKAQNVENGQFFNLAGQRVAQPTKGLYIVNGKKVIIK